MHPLAGTYTFATSVPLLGSFTVDVPVAALAEEAAPALLGSVSQQLKRQLPWVVLGLLCVATAGAVVANLLVPSRR
jgi:hypothetical protein